MTPEEADTALRRWSTKRMYPVFGIMIALGLGLIIYAGMNGTDDTTTASDLPEHVERLIPEGGSEVLAQSEIGIDLEVGYTAELVLNGTVLTAEDGLRINEQLGSVTFKPNENASITRLNPELNCVEARIRALSNANAPLSPARWCFTVS